MHTSTLPPEIIEQALREATEEQWASERGRRNAASRISLAGGRPKKMRPCPYCGVSFGVRALTAHKPVCSHRPS